MRKHALAATALTIATTGVAHAGGIGRDGDRSQILFEEGRNYVEFTASAVDLNVSGSLLGGALGSGNIQKSFLSFSGAYKFQPNDQWAFAIVANEPVGADVAYTAGTPYPFSGSSATVESIAVTGYVKYNFSERVSAYGGLRVQGLTGDLAIRTAGLPLPPVYNLNVDQDFRFGYVVGAAYQIPDIAMKVALTYESEIEHSFIDNTGTNFDVTIPQAVTLHAQSGISQNTLLFGSIRWQEWTEFQIRPLDFLGGAVAIASEPSDIWTYELGVGQRFNENWSGALTVGYEEDQGDIVGNLSGKDGFTSFGVAMKYKKEGWEVTTGIKYFDIGSTRTSIGANFSGNDAVAAGVKVGFRF
ncbi:MULTISPECIES: OmpP1/FadL family transporter [unclassified Roseovarius]|uniref:OmpP1/FadL family transporter n=1 Tax=unclassified Roseovarius TaxID=2614913 RepID=UPI00273FAD68|nr:MULTISPECIES: outer membrane protein transport protein [unclassified Roseovarius]